jgi:hypothetical protein
VALTVRPDDEVYQFDTVWLGPDEYTLPIQARYVAWGTWLACFLVAAAILIPLGGGGPAGVLGSLVWSLALSVVLSRAVMLVVDHERPLRSLPALFSAEARAAVAARRRAERALLVRPDKVRVRPTPGKVRAIRDRQRRKAALRADRRRLKAAKAPASPPKVEQLPVEAAGTLGPDWRADGPLRPEWTPDLAPAASGYDDYAEQLEPAPPPGWSVPGPAARPPATRRPAHAAPAEPVAVEAMPARPVAAAPPAGGRPSPFRSAGPVQPAEEPARAVRVTPEGGRHARDDRGGGSEHRDRQAAVEARILLPARKDR